MANQLKPMAIPNENDPRIIELYKADAKLRKIQQESMERAARLGLNYPMFATAVDPRLTEPVQPRTTGPSDRRILIAVGMALGCGLTLLFQLIFG